MNISELGICAHTISSLNTSSGSERDALYTSVTQVRFPPLRPIRVVQKNHCRAPGQSLLAGWHVLGPAEKDTKLISIFCVSTSVIRHSCGGRSGTGSVAGFFERATVGGF